MRIAGIGRDSEVHHGAVGFRYRDLTQLGDNPFTENEANTIGLPGKPCISRGSGSNQPGVQNGDRGCRDNRKTEKNEKKGRPH